MATYRMAYEYAGCFGTFVDMGWTIEEMFKWDIIVHHTTGNLYYIKDFMPQKNPYLANLRQEVIILKDYIKRTKR